MTAQTYLLLNIVAVKPRQSIPVTKLMSSQCRLTYPADAASARETRSGAGFLIGLKG